ncbi:hypothetical protein MJO28_015582 [Puccinia striiformis f. sp. tritici]|uniref:Uncharacterized protein n=1 Tax=Puccinia striiformis f. sp. tritici TaxID=168172 RepID=A0ACC0DPG7_9BASI|nr:hypothetical protein MJO28_015582 [Puccinia striiformis f. sp. tritici]
MESNTENKRYRLNNKNYATWATMMRAEMYGLGCLPLIKKEAVTDVNDKNMKLYILIMKHLDEEHIAIVNSELGTDKEGEGLELWELFKKKYAGSEAHHQMLALGEFIDLEFKETKEFVKEIRNGISKIRTSGLDVKQQVLALLILKKLPKEFESLVRIIIQDSGTLKTEDVINKIEKDYLQFKLKKADKVAMVGQQQQAPKRTGKCYNCDIVGHSAKECRKPWTNYKYAPPKANIGETDGISISFIAVNRELEKGLDQEEDISFYDPITTEVEIFGDLGNDGFYSQEEINETIETHSHCAMTGIISANNVMAPGDAIILDSGASDHMFNSRDDFSNYTEHNGKVEIGEVGRSVEIVGKGDVVLTANNNTITFCNAYHVPSLPYCLISQTALWNGGAQILKTTGSNFEVVVNGKKLFDGKISNRLPFPNLERKQNTCQISVEEHRRMGHPGGQINCEACRLGKQTRQPFSNQRERTDIAGEELSADVVGPIDPVSLGGARYFLTIVDTASRYAWVRLLKVKSQAEQELKFIVSQIENKTNKKVKRIITDGGGEFYQQQYSYTIAIKKQTHTSIGKMDPRCRKGILIGFDEGMKSYRIWDPETGKVVRSRDVSFEKVDDDTGDIFYDKFEASKTEETQNTESPTEPTINQGEDKTPEENLLKPKSRSKTKTIFLLKQ